MIHPSIFLKYNFSYFLSKSYFLFIQQKEAMKHHFILKAFITLLALNACNTAFSAPLDKIIQSCISFKHSHFTPISGTDGIVTSHNVFKTITNNCDVCATVSYNVTKDGQFYTPLLWSNFFGPIHIQPNSSTKGFFNTGSMGGYFNVHFKSAHECEKVTRIGPPRTF